MGTCLEAQTDGLPGFFGHQALTFDANFKYLAVYAIHLKVNKQNWYDYNDWSENHERNEIKREERNI